MNYFSHARVAAIRGGGDALVLGAMLPDFAHMIGVRISGLAHRELADGAALHHHSDAAFHASPTFRSLVAAGVGDLRAAGLARGPARAVAHVGIELLLDAALAGSPQTDACYLGALRAAPALESTIAWREDSGASRWQRLRARLLAAGPPSPRTGPERLAERIERVLDPRPRLRLQAAERISVSGWIAAVAADIEARAPRMLVETLAELEG